MDDGDLATLLAAGERAVFHGPPADAVPDLERIDLPELPSGYRDGWRLHVPVVDMPVHLSWLEERLAELQAPRSAAPAA